MKALPALLRLASILTDCQASLCSDICHVSCDTGEDIYRGWIEMTPEEIAESADECNKVCDPVCECMDNCIFKCVGLLRDCRLSAGNNIGAIYSCQSQFCECGQPCDPQCADAVTLAGTKFLGSRDRVVASLTEFINGLVEQMTQ